MARTEQQLRAASESTADQEDKRMSVMNTYCIFGDYVAADFFPAAESRIEEQLPFSGIVNLVLGDADNPEVDRSAVRAVLQPLLDKNADFLLIDLQDTGMLYEPEGDQPDPLHCSRARWKAVINAAAREILTVYLPEQLIVNEHYFSTVYLENAAFQSYRNSSRISRCNMLMRFLITEIENAAKGCHVIPFPAGVFDVSVVWEGEKEYQYHPGYYHYGQQAVRAILDRYENSNEETPAGRIQEESRIAIAHERSSELMTYLAGTPVLAAEEDYAERRRIRGLQVLIMGSDWLLLHWEENIYASDYLVERFENGNWEQVDLIDAVTEPCCRIEDLTPGTEYYFRVSVNDEDASHRYGQDIICRTELANTPE